MKKLVLVSLACLFIVSMAQSQQRTVEKTFAVTEGQEIVLELKFSEHIAVKAWDKDEVSFKSKIEVNGGKLNEALEIDFEEGNGKLKISADYNKEMLQEGRREDCPDHYSKYHWNNNDDGSYVVCSNITYELFVPRHSDLEVETISGDIELVDLSGPIRAKSISGFVDVSWPLGNPADISMKTISGEAFTDIENLQFVNKKDHIPLVGYKIKATLGSGGPAVSLESISGNIYLREAKS